MIIHVALNIGGMSALMKVQRTEVGISHLGIPKQTAVRDVQKLPAVVVVKVCRQISIVLLLEGSDGIQVRADNVRVGGLGEVVMSADG